jgi:hypothetical protein
MSVLYSTPRRETVSCLIGRVCPATPILSSHRSSTVLLGRNLARKAHADLDATLESASLGRAACSVTSWSDGVRCALAFCSARCGQRFQTAAVQGNRPSKLPTRLMQVDGGVIGIWSSADAQNTPSRDSTSRTGRPIFCEAAKGDSTRTLSALSPKTVASVDCVRCTICVASCTSNPPFSHATVTACSSMAHDCSEAWRKWHRGGTAPAPAQLPHHRRRSSKPRQGYWQGARPAAWRFQTRSVPARPHT